MGWLYRLFFLFLVVTAISLTGADNPVPKSAFDDHHNAHLKGIDGSDIYIGKSLGNVTDKINEALSHKEQIATVNIGVPFASAGLGTIMYKLKGIAEWGGRVNVHCATRVLEGKESRAAIEQLTNEGLGTVVNSRNMHDKVIAIAYKQANGLDKKAD